MTKRILTKKALVGLLFSLILLFTFSSLSKAEPLPKTIVLGANPPGSLYYLMSAGFAKVFGAHTPMKVEIFPQGGTVWYPMLEAGEVDFGINVPGDILAAFKGEAIYEKPTGGKGFPLRTLMLGTPLQVALLVTGKSDIQGPEDVRGKRMPVDYGTFYSATLTVRALLANYGLTVDDMKGLTVTSYPEGVRALMEGRADLSFGSLGSGIVGELDVSRGARYLPVMTDPEAVSRMKEVHPGYFTIKAAPRFPGVNEEMMVMGKNITLVTAENLSEDVAYTITKTLWDNYEELGHVHPRLKLWTKDRFASTRAVVPYHRGAIKLYKEKGAWTKELEQHQQRLMAIK